MKNVKLPRRPSDLIRVAIKDLVKVEESNKYSVDMEEWHRSFHNGPCAVCLAGSVMAMTLKVPRKLDIGPAELDELFERKFDKVEEPRIYLKCAALESFRVGSVHTAMEQLGMHYQIGAGNLPENFSVVEYHLKPKKFKKQMLKMAYMLEKAGF